VKIDPFDANRAMVIDGEASGDRRSTAADADKATH
jgi:hypothetical protein